MLLVPNIGWKVAAPPLVLTYVNSAQVTSAGTTHNFGNFTAPSAGLMIVGVAGIMNSSQNRSVASISIGGAGGTLHVSGTACYVPSGIASREVGAGSQAVTVTFSASMFQSAVSVWFLTGYASATPYDTANVDANTGGTSKSVLIDFPAKSCGVFIHSHWNSNVVTWTNASENYDASLSGGGRVSGASYSTDTALLSRSVTAAWSGSTEGGMSGATWH